MYIFFGREIEEISASERIRTNYKSKKAAITVIEFPWKTCLLVLQTIRFVSKVKVTT